jgi:predicted transcriptional regulator
MITMVITIITRMESIGEDQAGTMEAILVLQTNSMIIDATTTRETEEGLTGTGAFVESNSVEADAKIL